MSRHNRRRRRSHRPHSGSSSNYWADTSCNTFGEPSMTSYSALPRSTAAYTQSKDYSLFWNPMDGKNPWASQAPPDTGVEYLWRRGKPLPPGIALSKSTIPTKRKAIAEPVTFASAWSKANNQTHATYRYCSEEPSLPLGNDWDHMHETMFSVVGFLLEDDEYKIIPREAHRSKRFAGDRNQQPTVPEDYALG